MRNCFALVLFLVTTTLVSAAELKEVASFPDQQVTGVGVSTKSGRVFVNFPFWSDAHSISVAEIVNGQPKPFPNEEWNRPGPAGSHFICVQSVVVDDEDNLWVLDPASPKMQGIVKGGPKLVKIDLRTDRLVQTIPFGEDIAPAKSYLNDVRIDTRSGMALITDSGKGAIIVINLKNGNARRLLDGHTSTRPFFFQAEDGIRDLTVTGVQTCALPIYILRRIIEISHKHDIRIVNVFHAGDGNIHPILLFDERNAAQVQRVLAASNEILDE